MAAVHLHNALSTHTSLPDMASSSSSSTIRSGGTSLDLLSTSQFVDLRHTAPPNSPGHRRMAEERIWRSSRIWLYATLVLSVALLLWVTYCTVRYFVALRIYGGDAVRSRYALAMGITSILSLVFFTCNCLSTLRSFARCIRRRLRLTLHSLTYFSSALVLSLAVINLILVFRWRVLHDTADSRHSVQGRCNWDLDVVWSGTGGACTAPDAMPFGDWLGAAICRLVVTAVLLAAYHLAIYGHLSTIKFHETAPEIRIAEEGNTSLLLGAADDLHLRNSSEGLQMQESSKRTSGSVEHPRPLSFTEAGQVLSRVETNEVDEPEKEGPESPDIKRTHDSPWSLDNHIPRSDSPEIFTRQSSGSEHWYTGTEGSASFPSNPPPSSFHPFGTSANDLQDFASAFRGLVTRISRDTQEGLRLDTIPEHREKQRENDTVQVLGSYISRMSTIESIASREAANSSPTRSDAVPSPNTSSPSSSFPGSRNLSRDPTRNRPQEIMAESRTSLPPET